MELLYRPMTEDDIADVFSIRLATDENTVTLEEMEQEYGITPASITEGLRSHLRGWVCVADSVHPIGFVMGDASNGEVVVLAVRPAQVGRGIGKHLLRLVEQWLFDSAHDPIWLQSNPDPATRAYTFYRRQGWRSSGAMRGNDEILIKRREE